MPTVRRVATVAANGVVENVLAGSPWEFVGRMTGIEVAASQETGAGQVVMDVLFGSDLQGDAVSLPVETAAGRGPILPEDRQVSDVAAPGDRIVVRLRETAGVQTIVTTLINFTET